MKNRVSNLEISSLLKEIMFINTSAIDYITNEANRCSDMLKYNNNDFILKENLDILEYIKGALYFLDKQYYDAFEISGGKL